MDYRIFNDLGGLTVRYMQIFLVAAESGNFSSTAECLNTTQPLISRTIALLESELQVKLFHRSKKNMELTDAGKLLYTHWKTVLSMLRVSVDEARFAEQKLERAFVIADETVSDKSRYFYPFLYCFREHYPDVKVRVELMDIDAQVEQIRNGSADIAFSMSTNVPRLDAQMAHQEIICSHMYAWVYTGNPLSQHATLRVEDLAEEPIAIIDRTAAESFYDRIWNMYLKRGLTPKFTEICPNAQSFAFLRQNSDITILANDCGQFPHRDDIIKIPIEGEESGVVAFWNNQSKSRHLERALEVLDTCVKHNLFH